MSRTGLRSIRPLVSALALLVAAALAGCGADSGSPSSAAAKPAGSGDSAGSDAAFPVTIEHKYGETTIEERPERVVTVGLTEQDALLALGVVPVGTTEWFGGYPGAIGPWAQDDLGNASKPTVLHDTDGIQFEQIAALRPQLILALYSGLSESDYEKLSAIAPTVAQPGEYADYGIPWQELTTKVGRAVGRADRAEQLVRETEALFAKARREHPEFDGASGLMATPWQGIFVYGKQDSRSYVLQSLGFELPDGVDAVVGESFGANLSKERTDLLDTDALVWIVENAQRDKAKLHSDKLYGQLPVAEQGRDVYVVTGTDYGNAVSFVSVLSLPFVLESLVPQLEAAVDGDPGTKVPAVS